MVKIDKNIPFPEKADRQTEYPWSDLEKGDSFVYSGYTPNAQAAASYYSHKLGKTFKARRDPRGIVRVWRLE